MSSRRSRKQFNLVAIGDFDARRGYRRCTLPGVGVSWVGGNPPGASADFWRDRTGRLVVRFSSRGYVYHFAALLAPDKQVPERDLQKFGEFIADALCDWVVEGVDDVPEVLYQPPRRTK